jgi:hypothetical protein
MTNGGKMPQIKIDVDVYCGKCGNGICHLTSVSQNNFHVEPCDRCMEEAEEKGHSKGWDEGYKEGHGDGYNEGIQVEA